MASLEDSKDLTTMSIGELMSSLQAVEQRQNMRKEEKESKARQVDIALVVTEKTKYQKKIVRKAVESSSELAE